MELTGLDRRIVGALMVRPRASWSQIAAALEAPERTVARRGADLLESGVVAVRGMPLRPLSALVAVTTVPGTNQIAARALAGRPDTTFVYEVTGSADCLVEIFFDLGSLHRVLTEDVPAIPGVRSVESIPIPGYFKTLSQWRPGLLTEAERAALGDSKPHTMTNPGMFLQLDRGSDDLLTLLAGDGRVSAETMARRLGVSEATVRRRLALLAESGQLHLRAVVEPATIGLPAEVLVWIKAAPARVEEIGRFLASSLETRYVAALIGEYQILADFVTPSMADFYDLISKARWANAALQLSSSLLVKAHKRGGALMRQ